MSDSSQIPGPEEILGALRYVPVAVGALAWLIGGNVILARVARRKHLRWPTRPPLTELTLTETLSLTAFFLMALGGFVVTTVLSTR